jgi:hypothetical protein
MSAKPVNAVITFFPTDDQAIDPKESMENLLRRGVSLRFENANAN